MTYKGGAEVSQKQFKRLRKQLKGGDIDLKTPRKYLPTSFPRDVTMECVTPSRKIYQEIKHMIKTGNESRLQFMSDKKEEQENESITGNDATTQETVEAAASGVLQSPNEELGSKTE